MRKHAPILCCIAVLLLAMLLPAVCLAEEYEPLRVVIHDALTMKYEVRGGSGQYEVVSTSLADVSGNTVSAGDFEHNRYYYATVTVRDLVTGETATGTKGNQYKDPYYGVWSCREGRHTAYGSEDAGDLSENAVWVSREYKNITETEHTEHRTTAYHCIYCFAYMFSTESSVVEQHRYDRDTGYCKCGAYDPALVCAHTNINDDDFYIYAYEIVDDETHKEILYKERICADCGYDLGDVFWKEQTTKHFFFTGDDECDCGYRRKAECKHTRTAEEFAGNSYTPHEIDPYLHWEVPEYKITCLDCGYVRYETWPGIPYAHEYDENGKCICGRNITQVCPHDQTETILVDTAYTPSDTDSGIHWAEPNYQVICLDCGTVRNETGEREPEHHVFGDNDVCICGYHKELEDCTHENNRIPIEIWEKERYVIIEGELTYHRTYHETWQSFSCLDCGLALGQRMISSVWDLEYHSFDANQTCMQCRMHDETENRYELEVLDIRYRYGNTALVAPGDTVNIQVRDTVTGASFDYISLAGMKVEFSTSSSKNKLTPYGYLTMQDGMAEVVLKHYGKEIGRASIGTVALSVEEWGLGEGSFSGTNYVRLSDMLGVDWDATGMYLSEDLMMFNFTSVQTNNGDHIIHFDVFNSCSSTYAVASYTADGKLYEKHFISSYSPDFWIGSVAVDMCQALAEGLDRKWGNSGMDTAKTCIEIVVPAGGYYTFLEAHEDEEVMFRNVAECLLTALGNSSDFVDVLVPGDADQVDDIQNELKKPENARKFINTFWDTIKDEAKDEILDAFSDSSNVIYDLLKNESVQIALKEAMVSVGIKIGVKSLAETVVEFLSPSLAVTTDIVDTILGNVYWAEHVLHMEENASGESQIFFNAIVMPIK